MRTVAFSESSVDTPMPGANLPVRTAALRGASGGWAWLLVRFPPGFHRPSAGWYPADEEILLLDGSLEMSAETYRPGDYAFFPAGYVRSETRVRVETTTLAWFSAPPVWTEDGEPGPMFDPVRMVTVRTGSPHVNGPLGWGRALRTGPSDDTWLLDACPRGTVTVPTFLASTEERRLVDLDPGDEYPDLAGPVLLRI